MAEYGTQNSYDVPLESGETFEDSGEFKSVLNIIKAEHWRALLFQVIFQWNTSQKIAINFNNTLKFK